MSDVSVRPATAEDRPTVERLWLMFRHDLSGFMGVLPHCDGTFRSERVDSAFTEAGWKPYLFLREDRPVGFAFVRGLDGPTRVLNSFFVVRGARREGIGMTAVREVVLRHPGPWEVAFQYDNAPAVRFWRRAAAHSPRRPGRRRHAPTGRRESAGPCRRAAGLRRRPPLPRATAILHGSRAFPCLTCRQLLA